ncbi:hypothetical protein Tco_0618808 [Tanacetum coccineum]
MFNSYDDIQLSLNPIYAIKECSTCGVLCARCGTPVDGPYCQGCALLRKKFKEDLFTYCVENEFFKDLQDTSESSDDNTNVVNAPQEPFVGNQDPGENSSPSPPHIDHCCHECGDSLDGIFCRQCTEISSGSPTTHSELSLPDYKAFYIENNHFKEKSSGSTTNHVDFSQYDSFIFDLSNDHFPPADRSDLYHEGCSPLILN